MNPVNGDHPPRDPRDRARLDTYPVAHVDALEARIATLERELEQAKEDRARAAMDARNPLLARLAALEAEAKQAESDTGWAFSYGAIVHRDDGFWYAVAKNECGSDKNLFAAIRALRAKVELEDEKFAMRYSVAAFSSGISALRAKVEGGDAMKCPFCHMMPSLARGGIVQFNCGMVIAIDCVQQQRHEEIEAGRLYQPTACIRGERDRYIRQARKLRAAENALARHVAEDTRGHTTRQLVEAWEEAAR